jgi:hypothetical protein
VGQMLLLPHRITDDRFTPISGPYLKLIDWPKGARNELHAPRQNIRYVQPTHLPPHREARFPARP